MINNTDTSSIFKSNTTQINDKSLLLLLSLRINKNYVSQIDKQQHPLKCICPSSIASSGQQHLCKSLSKTMNNKYANADRDEHQSISNQRLSQSSTNSSRISETIDHEISTLGCTSTVSLNSNANKSTETTSTLPTREFVFLNELSIRVWSENSELN